VQQTVLFYFQIKNNSQFTVVFCGVLIRTAIGLDFPWCNHGVPWCFLGVPWCSGVFGT
jgi:hypothetical protein